MKIVYWQALVGIVITLALISFIFIFKEGVSTPYVASVPYILWSSFIPTLTLVILTYLGSKLFPYKED